MSTPAPKTFGAPRVLSICGPFRPNESFYTTAEAFDAECSRLGVRRAVLVKALIAQALPELKKLTKGETFAPVVKMRKIAV